MKPGESALCCSIVGGGLAIAALWAINQRAPAQSSERARNIDDSGVLSIPCSCGPAALIAAVEVMDPQAGQSLRSVLAEAPGAARPTTSLRDLADWATRCGIHPTGLHVPASLLTRLSPPFIVHLRPSHFAAVLAVDENRVQISDQHASSRWLPRGEFERWFSGHVLCLQKHSR